MRKYLLLLALGLTACDARPVRYSASGTVRTMQCAETLAGTVCHVGFEHDNGQLQELNFSGIVPFWLGLHCRIEYTDDADRGTSSLRKVDTL